MTFSCVLIWCSFLDFHILWEATITRGRKPGAGVEGRESGPGPLAGTAHRVFCSFARLVSIFPSILCMLSFYLRFNFREKFLTTSFVGSRVCHGPTWVSKEGLQFLFLLARSEALGRLGLRTKTLLLPPAHNCCLALWECRSKAPATVNEHSPYK